MALAPLALVIAFSAVAYAPGNWDSMTYRLARVAHWLQARSVAVYPTHVDRQIALSPGAEYVLAALQALAGTDRLASLLQLAAWVVISLAAEPLARIAGAGPRLARLGVVVAGTAPMVVLQASSTQNDLVAAAASCAVVSASIPFLGRRPRFRSADGALLGATLGVATLVKPTAVLVAAPFLIYAAASSVRAVARGTPRVSALLRAAFLGIALVSIVTLPDAALRLADARARDGNRRYAAIFLYPTLGAWSDRALNLVRGVARHLPMPGNARAAIGRIVPKRCEGSILPCDGPELGAHEDFAGNPLHVLLVLALGVVALRRWPRLPPRARTFLVLALSSWVLFQLTFRDNEWISRLETPLFALSPLVLAALAGIRGAARLRALRWTRYAAGALVALAVLTAFRNRTRRPSRAVAALLDPVASYYSGQRHLRAMHDAALALARERGCKRLGLYIGSDSYDYPLTWRAMQDGIVTRHVFGDDRWPCLVFTDRDDLPESTRWRPTTVPLVLENDAEDGASGSLGARDASTLPLRALTE